MNNILDNRTKITIGVFIFLYLFILGYGEYLQTTRHNLDVITQWRLCDGLLADERRECFAQTENLYIPNWVEKVGDWK